MTNRNDIRNLIQKSTRKDEGSVEFIAKKSMILTASIVLFTILCLLFDLTLRPYQVFSLLYFLFAVLLSRLTLIDVYERNDENELVMLTYLPPTLWFFLFAYFDLFFIGFGAVISFKSILVSTLLFLILLPLYAVLTSGLLDHIYEHLPANTNRTFAIGLGTCLVTIVIVWYFAQSAFHSAEEWIGLTKELCMEKYGAFTLLWSFLGFI